jgi:alkylation response protein AidB-like acyl-CoA dehydrogenase
MKINWSREDSAFQSRLRAFLAEHPPGKPPRDGAARLQWQKKWASAKFDAGWAGPSWPAEYGGMDLPFARQVIYHQEMAAARAPAHPGTGINIVGPTLIRYGNSIQRERFLRPMLRGDELWAQAFSEPDAGSDLPALRASAVRDGDEYVINGQKIWNTGADAADMLFALVRTGASGSRQKGITYLLLDARSEGVTVRPIRDMSGAQHFCEIFFDDVRVPAANRVGEENEGWQIARTSLGHERSAGALGQAAFYRRVMNELIELASSTGVTKDAGVRRKLADFDMRARLMEVNATRMVLSVMATDEPGAASSVSRLYNTEFEKELHAFATDLLGVRGALAGADELAVQRGRWVTGMLFTRASTIGAGTAEIQRNTIAEQVLGLPFDPAMPAR